MLNYFTRIIKTNGREEKYHAYWVTDKTGRRVQKLCKNPDGKRCTSKKNALEYIARLECAYAAEQKKKPIPYFFEYADKMFLPDSIHLARKEEHDRAIKENTRCAHRSHIEQVLIPLFGKFRLTDIDSKLLDDNLIGLNKASGGKYSGSSKNSLLYTLNIILRETKRHCRS